MKRVGPPSLTDLQSKWEDRPSHLNGRGDDGVRDDAPLRASRGRGFGDVHARSHALYGVGDGP
jgi:hypothetical protein